MSDITDTELDAIVSRGAVRYDEASPDFIADARGVVLTIGERDRLVAALRSERTQRRKDLEEYEETIDGLQEAQQGDTAALQRAFAELERERTQNRELRIALPHYVTEHFRSCARFGIKPGSQLALPERVCTCGLDDLLARAALSTQERENDEM